MLCNLDSARRSRPRRISSAGDAFFLRTEVSLTLATMLSAQNLACLCAASTRLRRAAQDLVRAAMEEQHGFVVAGCGLGDLRVLEDAPRACEIDCRRQGSRAVRRGNALCEIFVGSFMHLATQAQSPPARGDAWSVRIELKRGRYSLKLDGWRNPSHGVLSLFLNGLPVGNFDWSGTRTKRCVHAIELHVHWTGVHEIIASTDRSNAARCRRRRYWMCLRRLSIEAD